MKIANFKLNRGQRFFKGGLGGICLVLWLVLGYVESEGAAFDIIICGSGGEEVYLERFGDWGQRLRTVLVDQCAHLAKNVQLLTETGEGVDGKSSLDGIRDVMRDFSSKVTDRDDVFVFLIGHGSFRQQVAKLNVPGPDLTVEDLSGFLKMFSARRVVVVNGASMSAPFVNALSQRGRVICASTRSVDQRNATHFMGFFIQALEDGSADQDRDERISVLEICTQASSLTDAWYVGEGLIATENAILDDDGDGLGTRLSDIGEGDGALAVRCFLLDFRVPKGTAPELVEAYGEAIDEVQDLIKKKAGMDSMSYYQLLESKLLKAARLNREIRGEQ